MSCVSTCPCLLPASVHCDQRAAAWRADRRGSSGGDQAQTAPGPAQFDGIWPKSASWVEHSGAYKAQAEVGALMLPGVCWLVFWDLRHHFQKMLGVSECRL